jgi:molybdopterin-guanine dinucleotide biosynthesis protein A
MNPLIGVVLAGGRSSRMGQDKAMLDWQGVKLIDYMLALLASVGIDKRLVSGERPGYDCIADAQPGEGPGVALSHLLAMLPVDRLVLAVPVDMPLLTPELLHGLLITGGAAHYAGHPLPALLPTRAPDGATLRGQSIYALHRAAGSLALPLADEALAAFDNLNTPEEWQRAQRLS